MKTTDISSLTNSVMMAIEKELRKNDLAGAYHRHHDGNRRIIEAMMAALVADSEHVEPEETQEETNDEPTPILAPAPFDLPAYSVRHRTTVTLRQEAVNRALRCWVSEQVVPIWPDKIPAPKSFADMEVEVVGDGKEYSALVSYEPESETK